MKKRCSKNASNFAIILIYILKRFARSFLSAKTLYLFVKSGFLWISPTTRTRNEILHKKQQSVFKHNGESKHVTYWLSCQICERFIYLKRNKATNSCSACFVHNCSVVLLVDSQWEEYSLKCLSYSDQKRSKCIKDHVVV